MWLKKHAVLVFMLGILCMQESLCLFMSLSLFDIRNTVPYMGSNFDEWANT